MSKALVIIPTYNERENIRSIIKAVFSLSGPYHALIVDDGSPDGTAEIVHSLRKHFPDRLFIIERKGKQGLGTAYITGFKWGLERDFDFFFEMDADFSHNPLDLPDLLEACQDGADVAIGSRYVKGGKVKNWPLDRLILSYGASLYVRLITWMPVKDPTAGFICYRREVLETMDLDKINFIGYAFQIEMKFAAYQLGFKLIELPITFSDRVEGDSKMSRGIVKEAIWGVLAMRWHAFFNTFSRD